MSTISTSIQIQNQETLIPFFVNTTRSTDKPGFSADEIALTTTEYAVPTNYPSPRNVMLRLVSGDDVQVGTVTTGPYPLRLSGVDDHILLRLNVEGLREITTVVCEADVNGSVNGKYFEIREYGDTKVWVWYDAGINASGTITYGSPSNGDTVVVNGTTFTKAAAGSPTEFSTIGELEALIEALTGINASENGTVITVTAAAPGTAGNAITLTKTGSALTLSGAILTGGAATGATAPTVTTERLIGVTIAANATATTIATATATALDADSAFSCPAPAAATIVITDAHTGTRNTATYGTLTTWDAPTETQAGAASPTVYLKSAGTSQVVVAVAPN
jgi:hypothetical protein